ncbi:MAG: glutaredoxin [Oscillospiraceae bacterium]|nr:glutaredoxin [Oscillospiraceae bacterium]
MRIKVYGTTQCPDTQACLRAYESKGLPFDFEDITQLPTLKAFLAIRDTDPLYDAVKQTGGVGIPLVVTDDGRTLDWESLL